MGEEKDIITIRKPVPFYLFDPLFKKCFGEHVEFGENSSIESDRALFAPMFPIYQKFSMVIREIGPIVAKGSSYEENPSQIFSRDSLIPYKRQIDQIANNLFMPFFATPHGLETLKNTVYSKSELEKIASEKITNEEFFSRIFDDSLAAYYWSLLEISLGKRIGFHRTVNSATVDSGIFYEFTDIHKLIPRYDGLKALSFDPDDFLRNASREEIGDRLVDMLADFSNCYLGRRDEEILVKMILQIQQYSEKLQWDPTKFFKDLEKATPDPDMPTPAELLFK